MGACGGLPPPKLTMPRKANGNTDHHTKTSLLCLTQVEQHRFDELVAVAQRGFRWFMEVGEALAEIRDRRLYREKYKTWEEFLKNEFGFGRSHAKHLIDARGAVVEMEAELLTDVNISEPTHEAQVRPLLKLDEPGDRFLAWKAAVEASPGGSPTQREVDREVKRLLPAADEEGEEDQGKPKERPKSTDAASPEVSPEVGDEEDEDNDYVDRATSTIFWNPSGPDRSDWETATFADGSKRDNALSPGGCIPADVALKMVNQLANTLNRMGLVLESQVAIQQIATDVVAMINHATSGDDGNEVLKGVKYLFRNVFYEIPLRSVSAG